METKIVNINGVNHLCVDGKPIDTLAMKTFRPTLNNVGDFYQAGVRIFHCFISGLRSAIQMPYSAYGEVWFGEGEYNFDSFDKQMQMFYEAAPDAYIFINLHLDVRQWWLDQNPGNANSFTHLSQIAGNEKWRRDTQRYIRDFIAYAEEKYGDRIIGYWLLGGHTTEWFSYADKEESHPVKLEAFRKYMGDPNIEIPTQEELEKPNTQVFLDPIADRKVIDYRKFHAKLVSDLVLGFCKTAKEALNFKKVVGVFFGYIMELDWKCMLWHYGHLNLDEVNESPYLDLIATPTSYRFRLYDDGSAYMILADSLGLHDKAYFASFDNLTFLTPTVLDNPRRLCNDPETRDALYALCNNLNRKDLLNSREKTIHGMRREMMSRISKRCGTWWFDMLEGWYFDDGLMEEISNLVKRSKSVLDMPRNSAAEVCVFVGTEPLYYVNKSCGINAESIGIQRGPLSRMGAPYDLFSMSDLKRVDINKYKMVMFLDAYYLTDAQRDYINGTIKGGNRSVVFVGPCDYVSEENFSCERMSDLCEMQIDILPKDEAQIRAFNSTYGYGEAKTPTPYVTEADAPRVLGRFFDCRKCALAVREREDYKVFYSALGNLSHETLRGIAKMSGVHIYAEEGIFTYVNDAVVGVYNTGAATTEVTLKQDGEFTELFSGKTYKTENKKITLPTDECPAQMLILK